MSIGYAREFQVVRGYHEEADELGDRGDGLGQATDDAGEVTETPEQKAEKEAEAQRLAEKTEREKDVTIPKSRFDEAVGKERKAREAVERQNKELSDRLEAQSAQADTTAIQKDLDTLEEQLDKAMADNDAAEKKRLRVAIRAKNDELIDARVNARAAAATALAIEQNRYDLAVEKLETDYAFLNPDLQEGFDGDLAGEIMELKAAYEATGVGSAAALKKAIGTLDHKLKAKKAELEKDKSRETAAQKKEREAAEAKAKIKAAEEGKTKAEAAEAARREKAVEKGLKAKEDQPGAKTDASGKVDTTVAERKISDMSDADFEKLPESEKKRMRGD